MKSTIIVSGASRGIGFYITKRLLEDGFKIHAIAKNEDNLKFLSNKMNKYNSLTYSIVDLSNQESINTFIKDWHKPIYGLINNAGKWKEQYLEARDPDCLSEILDLNVKGVYKLTQGLLPHFSKHGRIINIASQLGSMGREGMGAYCASKHAIIGLTKCWALELSQKDILVNSVSPGWVMTESNIDDLQNKADDLGISLDKLIQDISNELILNRFIEPSEVANLVSFLISEGSSGVSGQDFKIK